jgi:predicted acetyltransferase
MISLEVPSLAVLPAYAAALATGWSPNTMRDVSAEQLAALRADPEAFLAALNRRGGGTVRLGDGTEVPRLPGCERWIWDGEFCGRINLRFQEGTEALPPYVSGHIGYAVVPWKRRRGYATAALALMLPLARAEGLAMVEITCDAGNVASRRVITANGGVLLGVRAELTDPGAHKLVFRLPTARREGAP